jgi:hypothetical protein
MSGCELTRATKRLQKIRMARVFVRVCAGLIALRSVTNFAKLFQGDEATLVSFGQILRGADAALPAFVIGVFMLATGIAMWSARRWAFPLIAAYATYVLVNLLVWAVVNPQEFERVGARFSSATDPSTLHWIGILGYVGYCIVAIGTTAGPAWILWKERSAGS